MDISFKKLTQPTPEIAAKFDKWESDLALIPFIRPNRAEADLNTIESVTAESLLQRMEHEEIYLIYKEDKLVGEMNYQVDPKHLYKKIPGTAWIGITIGEEFARRKGVGKLAMEYLEEQIRVQGFQRIELGVFEFNINAFKLYQKLGYQEISRIKDFTYWQDRFWQDIRMEKHLE